MKAPHKQHPAKVSASHLWENGTPSLSNGHRHPETGDWDRFVAELELELTRLRMQEQEVLRQKDAVENTAAFYADLFHSAPVGYLQLNHAGVILSLNDAAAGLLGGKPHQFQDKTLSAFIHKEQMVELLDHLRCARNSKRSIVTELAIQNLKGSQFPVELITSAALGPDHAFEYRMMMVDITNRKRDEEFWRDSERNYRYLVDSIEGIVWESTEQPGAFTFVSGQTQSMLGYPPERWLREPDFWEGRIHPADRRSVMEAREIAIAQRDSYRVEFRVHDAKRRVVWMRDSARVLEDSKGRIRLQGVMVNITDLKQAEESLREQTRNLETINRIGRLLASQLEMPRLVAAIADAGIQVTGARYGAFFYKHREGEEMSVHLTPQSTLDMFAGLPQTQPGASTASGTKNGRGMVCIDDLNELHQPRKQRRGSGHRAKYLLRSYLSMPVVSASGELLGTLIFAHTQPGIFTDRARQLLAGIASAAAIALDNARLYRAVSRNETHLRQLADAMPQIVWTAGLDGRVTYFNRRWYEYTGLPEGSVEQDWVSFLPPEDQAGCGGKWKKSVASGKPFASECLLWERAGSTYRWHLIRALPNLDEQGKIAGWFGTCTDIEEQKRVEAEIRDLNQGLERRVTERTAQLDRSNKELEAFSYSVSHDLRAPLRSICAFSGLLREEYESKLDDQAKEYLAIVETASKHMGELIDDLLLLSRMTRGDLHWSPVNLTGLAEHIIANFRQNEPERRVETSVAPGLSVMGDERLLRVAMENLLNNAWKFTSHSDAARIEVGKETQDGKEVFFVRDNGAGFDMDYVDKLFGAFQRLHSTNEFPGHGIGLATTQRIINRHGGTVWAKGSVGHSATFYFTIPSQAA